MPDKDSERRISCLAVRRQLFWASSSGVVRYQLMGMGLWPMTVGIGIEFEDGETTGCDRTGTCCIE
jgi:hypothetical protein